jgi:hypothetical protein
VRSHTEAEWRRFLEAAGLDVDRVELFPKRHPIGAWLARVGCAGTTAQRVRELLADRMDPHEPVWLDTKILLRGRVR